MTQHALLRADLPAGAPASIVQADLGALTADTVAVYWSDQAGLHSVSHMGTTVTDLGGPALASAIASDGASTLYAGSAQGIQAIPHAGGTPTLLAPAKQVTGLATALALEGLLGRRGRRIPPPRPDHRRRGLRPRHGPVLRERREHRRRRDAPYAGSRPEGTPTIVLLGMAR